MSSSKKFPSESPASVVQRASTSTVFTSSDFLGDSERFANAVIEKWKSGNETDLEPTEEHYQVAHCLYELYASCCSVRLKTARNLGAVYYTLYQTGSITAAESKLNQMQPTTPKFNHAYDFAVEICSNDEEAEDVTGQMLRSAILKRLQELDDDQLLQACKCFDTYDLTED